jgi:hypothetical protein
MFIITFSSEELKNNIKRHGKMEINRELTIKIIRKSGKSQKNSPPAGETEFFGQLKPVQKIPKWTEYNIKNNNDIDTLRLRALDRGDTEARVAASRLLALLCNVLILAPLHHPPPISSLSPVLASLAKLCKYSNTE